MAMPQGGTRIVTSDGGAFVRLLDVERRTVIWNKQVATAPRSSWGYRLETHIELFDRFWTTPAQGR